MLQWFDFDWLTAQANALSVTELAFACSAIFVGLTWFGIIFVRPILFRRWVRRQAGANDLVNYASAGFSLFYGLLLGLLAVAAFNNVSSVEASVDREAAGIATLYRLMAAYPEPLRSDTQALIRDYTIYTIQKDWPAHREGNVWNGGALRLQVIAQKLITFEPETHSQTILQGQSIKALDEVNSARQERVTGVTTAISGVLWYVVIIGAIVNIILICLLDMRLMLHLILGGLISFFLGVVIFVIAAMDRPLQGAVSVSPAAFQRTYDLVMQWDESK